MAPFPASPGLAVVFDGEVGLGDVATLDEEEFPIEEVADDGGFVPFGQVVLEVRVKGFLEDGEVCASSW